MIDTGELAADDRVIGEGMLQWAFVHEVRDSLAAVPAPAVPVASAAQPSPPPAQPMPQQTQFSRPSPDPISYFNPTARLTGRAERVLAGFPMPTGDQSPSPLSDRHLGEFLKAARCDRAIRQFYSMCNLLTIVVAIFGLFPSVLSAVNVFSRPASTQVQGMAAGTVAILVVLVALYSFAGRAAMKSRIWGPIAVAVVLALNAIVLTMGAVNAMRVMGILNSRSAILKGSAYAYAPVIPLAIGLAIIALLMTLTVRALRAVPRLVNSPVWCQEALIVARR